MDKKLTFIIWRVRNSLYNSGVPLTGQIGHTEAVREHIPKEFAYVSVFLAFPLVTWCHL